MSDARRCAVYARMARCDDPADMDAQVSALLQLSESRGFEVVKVYRDVASGHSGIDERPALKEMLEEVSNGAYDAIAVRDISRFARGNMTTAEVVLDTLRFAGTLVITPESEYRADNAEGIRLLKLCATATDFEHSPMSDVRRRLRRASQGKGR